MRLILLPFLALMFVLIPAYAADAPATADSSATAAIKQAEKNLAMAQTLTLDFSGSVLDKRPDRGSKITISGTARLMKPNFARIEFETSITTNDGAAGKSKHLIVADGKNVWRLDVDKNEYRMRPVDQNGRNILSDSGLPIDSAMRAFFVSEFSHATVAPTDQGEVSENGTKYRVIQFQEGEVDAQGMPLRQQRFYFGSNETLRFVNEQLHGVYVSDGRFDHVMKDSPMAPGDFAYKPPASAADTTPPPPKMIPDGSIAPEVVAQTPAGKPLKLSDYRGKIVVLDFWSVNCGPCIESREHLNSVAGKFKDDVVVLTVHVWDPRAEFDAWLPRHPQYDKMLFAVDPTPQGDDVATTRYRIPGVPALFLIGRDGKIIQSVLGYGGETPELENAIRKAGGTPRQ